MASILCSFVFILVLFSCFVNGSSSASLAISQPLCQEKESNALLKFKQSLTIDESVSGNPFAHNKVASWKLEGESNSDCCSWDGVLCDKITGHVIGLDLSSSFLFGSINSSSSLFTLVHLQLLNLAYNHFNYSHIPSEIGSLSGLKSLNLSNSAFSGPIPQEISQLSNLVYLDLSYSDEPSFTSKVLKLENPVFESLFRNLTRLEELDLGWVGVSSKLPDSIANLFSLRTLRLTGCNFSGSIPASIGNLSQLIDLELDSNSFSGQVPSFAGLSELRYLDIDLNELLIVDDLIWLGNLTKLTNLALSSTDLNGSILSTCHNQTHVVSGGLYSTTSLPKFKVLRLVDCNLKGFPGFLRYQDELEKLNLSKNKIHGQIPTWILNVSKESLEVLALSYNFLTGFEQHQAILTMTNLRILTLNQNMMQGPLPIPPPSVAGYLASDNNFSGQIPLAFCRLSFLQVLHVYKNNLTGTIPPCLSNFSDSLSILTLAHNNLQGPIPQNFKEGSKLKLIDLSHNQLQGKVPRSLENCKLLRSLVLSGNLIEDVFPFWLGSLPELQIMLLRSNKLNGAIRNPISEIDFPNLRICDLSHNNFTGHLPGKYFQAWNAMKSSATDQDYVYMRELVQVQIYGFTWSATFIYSMNIMSKGVNTYYGMISSIFTAIDLSSNKFEGEIPVSIGDLNGLQLLNFSNNGLNGEIPSSLGNLKNLETLDISRNKLSGKIPQQLTLLNFIELLNVSYNNLTGPIPKGKQFDTFQNDSYEGNSGLCGYPLSRKCGGVSTSRPPSLDLEGSDDGYVFPSGVDWVVIGLGYGSGVIVGVVIGQILMEKYNDWFIDTFERIRRKQTTQQRKGRRN